MGLGRHGGGVGAARYLAVRAARVTISDRATRESLAESLALLADVRIAAWHLGGQDEADFRTAEVVVVNPAVRPDHPGLQIASEAGAVLTSEIELFLRACPARVMGVTGSNGKSTTCAMLAAIMAAAGYRTWLGGNFGGSLLADLDAMTREDRVVLELSSFQLAHLGQCVPMPSVAVVTNCVPNHLDWHGDFDAYRRAKRRIIDEQTAGSLSVLNGADAQTASWAVPERTRFAWPLERIPPLAVPGLHNRHNAACAAAAAEAAGACDAAICKALASFQGLSHRQQFVAEVAERRFFNDSKSTSPQATLAALAAIDGPLWLLAGGYAKGAPFDELARAIVTRTRGMGLFGAAREQLASCVRSHGEHCRVFQTDHLADALEWCWRQSAAGDAIVLSPACASHDQFRDFVARGETFCRLVRDLGARDASDRA
jgi:UDP-N-acetylmuramoylalanine--D-glutamate ligase